ncbi:glycosyltransferase family 4 protein [Pedobacter sp. Du54]|uniref:glycosyltransferase family 4 protein n=1 Tax=Pedobacter anseongensis TaxID=3133439 RepID=UPI0030A68887
MRILKIVSSTDGGGVLTCETQYIKCMRSQGILVDLVIIGNGKRKDFYASLSDNFVELDNLKWSYIGNFSNRINAIIQTYRYGKRNLKKVVTSLSGNYDAVIYRRPNFLFLASFLAKQYDSAAFWHLPGIVSNRLAKMMYSFLCKKFSIVPIANSEYTKKSLGDVCRHFVYPGFDSKRIILGDKTYRNELGIPEGVPVYGMVARVCYDKAQDLLIGGFINSKAIESNGHLLIAGASNQAEYLKELHNLAGAFYGKNVHFLGEITDLSKFYSTIDVAVNSRRNVEAFGISIAEALGAGKPIIAYKLGGPSEMIKNNVNGWLIDYPNLDSYRQAIDLSLSKKSEWESIGFAGKAMSNIFSVDFNVSKLLNIIRSKQGIN